MAVYGQCLVYEDVDTLLEFSLSESLKSLKERLVKAFIRLIERIQEKLSNMKDSKFKSVLMRLLTRAKNGLSKSKKVYDKDGIEILRVEAKEIKKELEDIFITKEFKHNVEKNYVSAVRDELKKLLKNNYQMYRESLKYAEKNMDDLYDSERYDDYEDTELDNPSNYSEGLVDSLIDDLDKSFTKSKLIRIEKVVRYLYFKF